MPIVNTRAYFPRLGTISMGYKIAEHSTPGEVITTPKRSDHFVFHTDHEARAAAIARLLGGTVERAPGRDGDAEMFYVITNATTLPLPDPYQ